MDPHYSLVTRWSLKCPTVRLILGLMSKSLTSITVTSSWICSLAQQCYIICPSLILHLFNSFNLQDSSSGNTSDVESQEGVGRQSHKSKAKDRTSTTGKDGSQRHSASQKATAGYKVEDKTTWTLLQQQQQHFSTPSSSFYYYHSLTPSIPPPLPSFLHFFLQLLQFVSFSAGTAWSTQTHKHTHKHTLGVPSSGFFVVVVFRIATWLFPPVFLFLFVQDCEQ